MDRVHELAAHIARPPLNGRIVLALVLLAGAAVGVAILAHSTIPGVIGALLFVAAIGLHRHGATDAPDDENGMPVNAPPLLTGRVNTMSGGSVPAGGVVDSLGCPRGFGPRDLR